MVKQLIFTLNILATCALSSYLQAMEEYTLKTKLADPVICTRVDKGELKKEEEVFIRSFSVAYRDIPLKTLGVESLPTFLKAAFEDEAVDLNRGKEMYFFDAKVKETLVGIISFEPSSQEGEIYIRQLAVDPEFKGKGVGKALVSLCNKKFPTLKRIVLATRRVNEEARVFYTALGFKETNNVPHGLNPERYVGYEFNVAH